MAVHLLQISHQVRTVAALEHRRSSSPTGRTRASRSGSARQYAASAYRKNIGAGRISATKFAHTLTPPNGRHRRTGPRASPPFRAQVRALETMTHRAPSSAPAPAKTGSPHSEPNQKVLNKRGQSMVLVHTQRGRRAAGTFSMRHGRPRCSSASRPKESHDAQRPTQRTPAHPSHGRGPRPAQSVSSRPAPS